jgi:hypothetical protein
MGMEPERVRNLEQTLQTDTGAAGLNPVELVWGFDTQNLGEGGTVQASGVPCGLDPLAQPHSCVLRVDLHLVSIAVSYASRNCRVSVVSLNTFAQPVWQGGRLLTRLANEV